jgi:large subunit ribosomal protein L4
MQATVYDKQGKALREADLPEAIFGGEPNRALMHQALVRQLANARQGTHDTQTRAEVSRTTKKWFRQKGTGNARHGSRRAPIFVGGGVAHGPHPRSYAKQMPKRMRRAALRSALAAKAAAGEISLIDGLDLDAPRTRDMARLVDAIGAGSSALIVLPGRSEAVERSVRNLANAKYLHAGYLNIRDLLGYERLIMPLATLEALEWLATASPVRPKAAAASPVTDTSEEA